MSEFVKSLQINKYILSKLWYTSLVVYQENANDKSLSCQSDTVDYVESDSLIESVINLIERVINTNLHWVIDILVEPVKQRISIKQIFTLLQHFNSLLVLKMTINLHEEEYSKIRNLLKDVSEPENIFSAYCSMFSALKAILLCDSYDTRQSIITRHITEMKRYVNTLYPLSLRIEVIKNIFSFLFLRHDDFNCSQKSYDKSNVSTSDGQRNFENKWMSQTSTGFVCNKYAIRDILLYLKEIVLATENEFREMIDKDECTEDTNQIQKDICSINAAVMDAKWRLELYTSSQFTEDINVYKDANKNLLSKPKALLDGKLISNRIKEKIFFYQQDSTSDDTKTKSNSNSDSELIHNNAKYRKHSKNVTITIDATATKDVAHKPLFVNFMLATKESLVIQCLWKNDYAKAQDIIENVRLAAKEGIHSSRQTSQLETFLASQEINLQMLNVDILSSNEMLTICVLDIALTMSQIHSVELSTGDETLAFLLNTWNLMFLHACLTVWVDRTPFSNLQHAISLMSIGYFIGDLGLVTFTALRSKLLDNIMLDNKFFMELEELNEPVWQDLDITHDPRVIFMMANEFYGTPCIRACNPETLNETLSKAIREYFDYYSPIPEKPEGNTEEEITTVLLPDVVKRYQNLVSENKSNICETNSSENMLSVDDYYKSSNKNVTIQYMLPSYSDGVILKYTDYFTMHHQKQTHSNEDVWKAHTIRPSLLQYLENHCWVVSYLLQRIHNEHPTILENSCDNLKRTACLENLLSSSWVDEMKSLVENNQTLAVIVETIPIQKLWRHFEIALEQNEWHTCLRLINALPDNLVTSTKLQYFKDKVLSYIVSNEATKILQYIYQIKDMHILSQTVLHNMDKWDVSVCENALLHALHHVDSYKLPMHCKLELNEILRRVLIFHQMLPYCITKGNGTWYDIAYCTDKIDPFQVIKSLINADKFELCLEWLESQAFSLEIHPSKTQDFLIGPIIYRRTLIGIEILRMLDTQERLLYIHLIKEPLLMLEQLLMNCKLECIQKILNTLEDRLSKVDISRDGFDKIVRFYAKKSLDCRVSLQCDNTESKSKTVQHSESESTEFIMPVLVPTKEEWVPNEKARKCSCCKTVIFSMFNRRHHCRRCGRVICAQCSQHRMQVSGYPPSVLVRVCDDCKQQTVLQTQSHQGRSSTPSSEMFDYWRLTRDEKHNETIREEFSFEYAPNISLCLAILNLHSDHETYTSFLLDRCDEFKCLLQPVNGEKVNPEVDHTVIIKMIRSLLVAAKVKCAKLGLNAGLVHCDRFLSQVDLIASLVQFDCLHLIPSDNLDGHALRKLRDLLIEKEQWTLALDVSTKAGLDTQGVWATWGKACLKIGYFDQAREKFLHCLDKIQHEDFDDWVILSYPKDSMTENRRGIRKSVTENTIDENKEFTMEDELSVRKTEISKNRPLKDPPLLTEILQILDNLSTYKQHVQYEDSQYKSSAQQEISNNFRYLKVTNQGQSLAKNAHSAMQNVYYYESLYYLLICGSCNSILEFFLRHDEFNECLAFTLETDPEPDLFYNVIYLYCLKTGNTEKLHEAMKSKDCSLLIWKKYLIYVCHSLEKRHYLNILYQLQLFMKDSIRAAMTCIRFYRNEINDYSDLHTRGNFLLEAQKHLEYELQVESLNRRRKKSTSSMHSNQGILTMEMEPSEIDKHINTISRQMEIVKFLATCEKEGRAPVEVLNFFPGKDSDNVCTTELPTLFGNQQQKIDLAVLAILCGRNIEEGFGIAFRIMQDYNLPQQKVYSLAGHILTLRYNIPGIEQLIKCCHTSGIPNSYIISDYVLTHCVKLLLNRLHDEPESSLKNDVLNLIRLITDIELKINAYIDCKQLKAAYLVAVKYSRAHDIRKILKESDRLGQNAIKAICIKWLQRELK
ncbi:Zinc finger FYVE domain-containing protein 26, partial [Dufourea novaeangliae]